MNRNTLRNVSVVTLVLAVALGLYAIRLGQQLSPPQPDPKNAKKDLVQIVVAVEPIEAGRELRAESFDLEEVSLEPEGAFRSIDDVVGRVSSVRLVPGEPIMEKHFRVDSKITQRLDFGERAMAVKVDGVIGMGGFIQPGDRVDVLVYMARDQKEVKSTHARVLLEDIRVLAYGEKLDTQSDTEGTKPTEARTAVLAVPQSDVSQLMLGASKGRLRLALRSPSEGEETLGQTEAISLGTLAGDFGKAEKKAAVPVKPVVRKPRRVVHRGDAGEITRY